MNRGVRTKAGERQAARGVRSSAPSMDFRDFADFGNLGKNVDSGRVATTRFDVRRVHGDAEPAAPQPDVLAVEEPLEMRVFWREGASWQERALAVTMRTPGEDDELALGFLWTEGLVRSPHDIVSSAAAGNA